MKHKILLIRSFLVLAILLAAPAAQAQTIDPTFENAKLFSSEFATYVYFGYSVSISGDTAIVGALGDDDKGSFSGSAYIFVSDGTSWTEQAKLTATDGAPYDFFGYSVAIFGDTVIVGSLGDGGNGFRSGSAYIFVRDGASWTQQDKLTASDGAPSDEFGQSVSISGDTVIVGAYGDDIWTGSAYVFVRNAGTWIEQAKLTASDGLPIDSFGWSVSISGNTVIVGARLDNDGGPPIGSAYVFVRNATVWTEQAKLTAFDGEEGDTFGESVAISGDTVIVGAQFDSDNGVWSGAAYIFERVAGFWTEQSKLVASDGAAQDQLGHSVSISGDTAIVGARFDDDNGVSSGSAYIFVRNAGVWTEQNKLLASDGATDDWFGWSVSISGDTAIVGARHDGDNGFFSGSAYIFFTTVFDFVGFFPPVENLPVLNTAQAGQSIPFKWQIPDGQGGFISDLGVVSAIQYAIVACPEAGSIPENAVDAETSGNSGLSYEAGAERFKFVWKTPKSLKGQCADFYVGLSDGSFHTASFSFE